MKSSGRSRLGASRRGRLIAGLIGLLVSLGYGQQAWTTLPMGKPSQPGAAVFPIMVAALMAASSLMILGEEMRSGEAEEEALKLPSGADLRRLLGVLAGLVGYVVVASLLGHLLGSILLSLALVHLIKPGSWLRTVVAGLAIALSAYVLFVVLLAVPLPTGGLW